MRLGSVHPLSKGGVGMGPIGVQELLLILLIVILLFGAKKIPELASGLGKGLKEFKKAQQDANKEIPEESSKKKDPAEKPANPEAEGAGKV